MKNFDEKKLKAEIEAVMKNDGYRFNVESLEDAMDSLDAAVEYVIEFYTDCDSEEEMAREWLFDTRDHFPEMLARV